jgi:hypothetical protein
LEEAEKQNKFRLPCQGETKKRLNLAALQRGIFLSANTGPETLETPAIAGDGALEGPVYSK